MMARRLISVILTTILVLPSLYVPISWAAAHAHPDTVPDPFGWGTNTINVTYTCITGCGGDYHHTDTIDTYDPGTNDFSGTGSIDSDRSYTEVMTGHLSRSGQLTWHLLYTGNNKGYTVDGTATRRSNRSFVGTAFSSVNQHFTVTLSPQKGSTGSGATPIPQPSPSVFEATLAPCRSSQVCTTVTIPGNANIFGAGHASLPTAGGGGGSPPPTVTFSAHADQVLTFTSVTGQVKCTTTSQASGPVGPCEPSPNRATDINSVGGIAGIVDSQSTMFLVGVFLDDLEPHDPAPPRLDFSSNTLGHEFTKLAPVLNQVFYIGDGKTSTGKTQQFAVPAKATRLVLGFADAFAFHGDEGWYGDDSGSLTAMLSVEVSPASPSLAPPDSSSGSCPQPWTCADVGHPASPGDQRFVDGTWTISGGGTDIWGGADQFHYVWQSVEGDGFITARVTSQTLPDISSKAGVMLRQDTDPDAPNYYFLVSSHDVGVAYRAVRGGDSAVLLRLPHVLPSYLGVRRQGNTFTAYTSTDGQAWSRVPGSTMTISMGTTALAGLAVTAHKDALSTATFDHVSIQSSAPISPSVSCPQLWTCADIGNPVRQGGQKFTNGAVAVWGGGADIWGNSDQFHYVAQSTEGDQSISARITAQDRRVWNRKAGVMIRVDAAPNAPNYYFYMTPKGVGLAYRTDRGGATVNPTGFPASPPTYLKVGRRGNEFTAYTSRDGSTWMALPGSHATIDMPVTALGGLAVTAYDANGLSTATFDHVSIQSSAPNPSPTPTPPTNSRAIVFVHGIAGNYADTNLEKTSQRYTTFIHNLRQQFGLDNVIVFPFYQDLGYALPPLDYTPPCDQNMPAADMHAIAEYPFVPVRKDSFSPMICDSLGDLGMSALLLDKQLQQLAQHYSHITLIANSMGGAITRGWLALRQVAAQRTHSAADLRAVDSVIFIQGAQQGSYIAGQRQYLCSPFAGLANQQILDAIINKGGEIFIGLKSTRPAAIELAPRSQWYDFTDYYGVPRGVHYYNFYTSERVHHYAAALWGRIEKSTTDLGDLVILPGSDAPDAATCSGGARFLPGSSTQNGDGAGHDSYQWQIANTTHDLIDFTPTDFLEWGLQSDDIWKDPTNHIQLGTGNNMGLTYVADCRTHAPITITDQIKRIIRDPIHVCDSEARANTHAAPAFRGGAPLSPRSAAITAIRQTSQQGAAPLSSAQASYPSQIMPRQKRTPPASPSVFTDRSGVHIFSVQLRPGVAPIGSFQFVIGHVGEYDGIVALRRRGAHDIEVHQTLQVGFSAGHRSPQVIRVHLDGRINPVLHSAIITMRLLSRHGVVYRLVTERITASSAQPVIRRIGTVLAHDQWNNLYNILPEEVSHLYTRMQFAHMLQGSAAHAPQVLRIDPSGAGTIVTDDSGMVLFRQPLRIMIHRRVGGTTTFMSNLYLIRENGSWRFWTTDPPPTRP